MSESFKGAMMFTELMFPDCDKSMLDRLQRAHDYDMDELRRKLDSMTQEYLAMRSALDTSSTALRCTLAERDEARKKLDKIQGIIDASDKAH